jgi:hypothetical protein
MFPSSQLVPSGCAGFEQAPDAGSQAPGWWHESSAWHATVPVATQTPAWQVSPVVHLFPSSHVVPVSALHWPSVAAP